MLETAEEIKRLIDWSHDRSVEGLEAFSDMELVHIANRFAMPSDSGYRDLKLYLRSSNGFVSCLRVASRPFERQTFFSTSSHWWQAFEAKHEELSQTMDQHGPVVIIRDNYLKDEPDHAHYLSGFQSNDEAATYALSRFHQSLSEVKRISNSVDDLIDNWMMFGENVGVLLEDGLFPFDSSIHARILEVDMSEIPLWDGDDESQYLKHPIDEFVED